jgi:hypothetical protein
MVAEGGRKRAGLSTATVAGPAFAGRWGRVALGQALPPGGCRGQVRAARQAAGDGRAAFLIRRQCSIPLFTLLFFL